MKRFDPIVPVLIPLLIAGGALIFRPDPENISLPPVSTFKSYCARCHGYEGTAYGKDFGNLAGDSLSSVTGEMMFGPAGLNPDSIDIAAMTAYNKSIRTATPFGAVVNAASFLEGKDSVLVLDTAPRDSVGVETEGVAVRRNKEGWDMRYDLHKIHHIEIIIERNGKLSRIGFPGELWVQ